MASQEYTDLMDRFKAEEVPLAVSVISMDWHKTIPAPLEVVERTGYSWNRDLIPDQLPSYVVFMSVV